MSSKNSVLRELQARGYQMYPVHRSLANIGSRSCYASLKDIPDEVDGVVIVVPPEQGVDVMRQAVECGIRRVWLQQGAESEEAISFCRSHEISVGESGDGTTVSIFVHKS